MESDFEKCTGFQWDEGNKNKNLLKHQVENWECEQVFFNEPLLVLHDPKLCITASDHLCPISKYKNLEIARYSCNFCTLKSNKADLNLCAYLL